MQRPLPDSTQQSQETDIRADGGIRTRNPSKQAAADPRPFIQYIRLLPAAFIFWLKVLWKS